MITEITKYFIHQLFDLCLVSDRISILSYYMLLAMDWTVKSASKEVITLTHPKLKNKLRNGISFYSNYRMYVAFDPTLLSTWVPLSGEDCIGHLGSVINDDNEPRLMYRTGYDDGDTYSEAITAVTTTTADADTVESIASRNATQRPPSGRPPSKKRHHPIED